MKSFAIASSSEPLVEIGDEGLSTALQYGLNVAAANADAFIEAVGAERAANARYFAGES